MFLSESFGEALGRAFEIDNLWLDVLPSIMERTVTEALISVRLSVFLSVNARLFCAFCLLSASLYAQRATTAASNATCSGTARSVHGEVTDTTGSRVAHAVVRAVCGIYTKQVETNANGEYVLDLKPGSYALAIEAPGFAPEQSAFAVSASGDVLAPKAILHIANASTNVIVSADVGMAAPYAESATKSITPVLLQPFSIATVTSEQMTQQNSQNVVEALAYTAGAQSLSANAAVPQMVDSFNLRGFAADEYLDGMRIPQGYNAVQSGPGSLNLDPNDLERLEILLGPSSTLYGQSNLGGIVDAVSKQPTSTSYRSLQFQAGTYSWLHGAGDFSGPINHSGTLLYRIDGVARNSDTYVYGIQDNRYTINPTLAWYPSAHTSLTAYAKLLRTTTDSATGYAPALGTVTPASYGFLPVSFQPGDPTFDRYRKNQIFTGYRFDHQGGGRWTIQHQLRYVHSTTDTHFLYPYLLGSDGITLSRFSYTLIPTTDGIQTDTHARGLFNLGKTRHSVIGGLDYQWQKFDNNYGLAPGSNLILTHPVYGQGDTVTPLTVKLKQAQYQGGLYGQDDIELGRFTVVAGGRGDFTSQNTVDGFTGATTSSQNPNAFTGHVGASYHVKGIAPYFGYSTSFLPTLGSGYDGKAFVPTRGSNIEGGLKYQPNGTPLIFRIAGFSLTQQNVTVTDPDHPTFSIQQGEVHTPGAEVQLNGAVRRLDFTAAFTHIEPAYSKSTTALHKQPQTIADNTASLWMHYVIPERWIAGLGFGGGARFVGQSWGDSNNTIKVPGFTVFDGALDYTRERVRFAVNAKNLGNRKYVDGCYSAVQCAYGAAVTVVGSTTFTF